MWEEDDSVQLVEGQLYAIVPMAVYVSWKNRTALPAKNIDVVRIL